MALNSENKVVGVALNGITKPRDFEDWKFYIDEIRDPQLRHLMNMQLNENLEHNVFDLYKIRKLFDLRLLSVDNKNYNGFIMGKQLVKLTETLASNKNHKILKADATGDFAQKILSTCGFKCLHQKDYSDYKDDEDGTTPLKKLKHSKYQLLFKKLEG